MALKIIVDIILCLIPALNALLINLYVNPFPRGFFCNDESLSLPFKGDTISILQIAFACLVLGISIILIVELINTQQNAIRERKKDMSICKRNIPMVVQNLYKYIGMFLFVLSVNQFLIEMIKCLVGRLRPHFYSLCLPQMRDGSTCDDPQNHHKYIQDFTCTNSNATSRMLTNMRSSFPSGHSSLAFATAVFCILYIQARTLWRGSKLMKNFLQVLLISAAIYVALTRIMDYMHHWSDVFAGSLLGTVIALLFGLFSTDFFKSKERPIKNLSNHQV